MAKELKFKEHSLQELKNMSLLNFANLVSARARRTLLRNHSHPFYQKFENGKVKEGDKVKTHCRDIIITPKMIGTTINVYNGKEFLPVEIKFEMLGYYLGEFSFTRRRIKHGKAGIGATKSSTAIASRK